MTRWNLHIPAPYLQTFSMPLNLAVTGPIISRVQRPSIQPSMTSQAFPLPIADSTQALTTTTTTYQLGNVTLNHFHANLSTESTLRLVSLRLRPMKSIDLATMSTHTFTAMILGVFQLVLPALVFGLQSSPCTSENSSMGRAT